MRCCQGSQILTGVLGSRRPVDEGRRAILHCGSGDGRTRQMRAVDTSCTGKSSLVAAIIVVPGIALGGSVKRDAHVVRCHADEHARHSARSRSGNAPHSRHGLCGLARGEQLALPAARRAARLHSLAQLSLDRRKANWSASSLRIMSRLGSSR